MQIHLIFKTHLDIGFTDDAQAVTARYMSHFIPGALALAERLREEGYTERFVWTTGAWLIYEYMEQASHPERERMEQAIARGDIAWHALPFTTHTELMDVGLLRFGLSLSQELDRRYGRTTIAAKMTDVPGHTRAMLPHLAAAGVRFLHLGVNEASHPPDVPPVFVWRHTDGSEVVVMYHGSYGGEGAVAGLDHRLIFAHSGDNLGPPAFQEVIAQYLALSQRYPSATLQASTLDAYARALLPHAAQLPVVTSEIGDTWIHGVGTDPLKVAQYRALLRLRATWADAGWDAAPLSRRLLLVPEHTWGMDIKVHLNDHVSFSADEVAAQRDTPRFRKVARSWDEQRGYVRAALKTLDAPRRAEADAALAELRPRRPMTSDWAALADPSAPITAQNVALRLDPESGALVRLRHLPGRREWATPRHPLALLRYQTFGPAEFDRFQRAYNTNYGNPHVMWWATSDFGKPGLERTAAQSALWQPRLRTAWERRDSEGLHLLVELDAPDEAHRVYGCAKTFTLEYTFPDAAPRVDIRLQWFDKPATRMPEATWLSFTPRVRPGGAWSLIKLGEQIDPLDVVRYGAQHLHAVDRGVDYRDKDGGLAIDTLDAPLVSPGAPGLLRFGRGCASVRGGMHVNLHNTIWGTNFPQWYGEDALFRFSLRLHDGE